MVDKGGEQCEQCEQCIEGLEAVGEHSGIALPVLKYRVLGIIGLDERLDRYGRQVGNDDSQFFRDALGIGTIGDDEAGHVGQSGDGFGKVAIGRFLDVEDDGQVVALAEFVMQGVKDALTLEREAAEDERDFAGDGVEDVENLLLDI